MRRVLPAVAVFPLLALVLLPIRGESRHTGPLPTHLRQESSNDTTTPS